MTTTYIYPSTTKQSRVDAAYNVSRGGIVHELEYTSNRGRCVFRVTGPAEDPKTGDAVVHDWEGKRFVFIFRGEGWLFGTHHLEELGIEPIIETICVGETLIIVGNDQIGCITDSSFWRRDYEHYDGFRNLKIVGESIQGQAYEPHRDVWLDLSLSLVSGSDLPS